MKFTIPGASNTISVSLPFGLGAGSITYVVGPAIDTKLGGGTLTVTGDHTEMPCEGGCISVGFSVPFSITVSAGVSLEVWIDLPIVGELSGIASAVASATIGDISITGNRELFGTGCSNNSVSVTAGKATGDITITVSLQQGGDDLGDWTTTLSSVTLWNGLP